MVRRLLAYLAVILLWLASRMRYQYSGFGTVSSLNPPTMILEKSSQSSIA